MPIIMLMLLCSSATLAIGANENNSLANFTLNDDALLFADPSAGNWIELEGGTRLLLPDPLQFQYTGVNSTGYHSTNLNIDLNFNISQSGTEYSKEIDYPYSTHPIYTEDGGNNNVTMKFNGSSDFKGQNVTVYLIKAKGSEVFDGFSKLRGSEITDYNKLFNTSFKTSTKYSTKVLDQNGDLSLALGKQPAGHYLVLVLLDDADPGSHSLLSATAFEVLPYEMSLSTSASVKPDSTIPIDISVNGPKSSYTYAGFLVKKDNYRAEIGVESDGRREGTNLSFNGVDLASGIELPSEINTINDVLDILDVDTSNLGNITEDIFKDAVYFKESRANSTTMNLDLSGHTEGDYILLMTAINPGESINGIVGIAQTEFTISAQLGPTANFIATPSSGYAPLEVQFKDTSTNGPTSWSWDFGDGNNSAERNPVHTYSLVGNYTVSLTVKNENGQNTKTDVIRVTQRPSLVANFTASLESGMQPFTVQFNDSSTGGPTAWYWAFGDGSNSTEQNPIHTYNDSGIFNVSLRVTNQYGENTTTKTNFITVVPHPGPVANFSAYPESGMQPLTVQFNDNSTGDPADWYWTFGDGGTSTEQNPTHIYVNSGIYNVSLRVSNKYGENTSTKINLINVSSRPGPIANFTAVPKSGMQPLTVQFNDNSTGNPVVWLWDFGDESSSKQQNPTHTYYSAGNYTVSLTVLNIYGQSTKTDVIQVVQHPGPVANFSASPREGTQPLTVQFTDKSANNPIAWIWTFGDGYASTEQNPSHKYLKAGNFTVSLKVISQYGEDTVSSGISVVEKPIVFNVTADKITGTAPFIVTFTDNTDTDRNRYWKFEGASKVELISGSKLTPQGSWYMTGGNSSIKCTYENPGTYYMRFKVAGLAETKKKITVESALEANFTASPNSGEQPLKVQFNDTSKGSPTAWIWDFGDGYTSIEQSPSHTYELAGTYNVTFTAMDAYGESEAFEESCVYVKSKPAPVASFTAENRNGKVPLSVEFRDTSTNLTSGTTWFWDFGDGQISTEQSPTHTYEVAGSYAVTLKVLSEYGEDSLTVPSFVEAEALPAPTASFEVDPNSGTVPLSVQFTDKSENCTDNTAWFWTFGDGAYSTKQNPTHTYLNPGTFSVILKVISENGVDTESKIITAESAPAPSAEFKISGSGFTVNFSAPKEGAVAWFWSFGDGTYSTEQNPTHTYSAENTYNVSLRATNDAGDNFSYLNIEVSSTTTYQTSFSEGLTVAERAVSSRFIFNSDDDGNASFSSNVTSGTEPLSMQFTDKSTNSPVAWFWTFGDGTYSTEQNPVHTYIQAGTYSVSLRATNNQGDKVSEKTNYITVNEGVSPVAGFEATLTTGNAPLTVSFTDQSSNAASWFWTFGDGYTSNEQNPKHTYLKPGSYTVNLTVNNAFGSNMHSESSFISVGSGSAPSASFTNSTAKTGPQPLNVQFNDTSTGATIWLWDFGDGIKSTLQNPSHTYGKVGNYSVSLKVINAYGNDTTTKSDFVTVTAAQVPVASFERSPASGTVPLSVKFTDKSANNPIAWIWIFGDGYTSNEQNPKHTYTSSGTFNVSLKAISAYGSNTKTWDSCITVDPGVAPVVNFSANITSGSAPLTVQFNDTTENVSIWFWDFGDGSVSSEQNPLHTYNATGNFNVSLDITAENDQMANETKYNYITVSAFSPVANFTASPESGSAPLTVQFNDTSANNPMAWIWNFGDGATSSDQSPKHIYETNGIYNVTLNAINAYGISNITKYGFIEVSLNPGPVANFTYSPKSGFAPLTVQFTDNSTEITDKTAWLWNFGDGESSSDKNPSHTYSVEGNYTVTLMVINIYGDDTETAVIIVNTGTGYVPVANFTASPTSGYAPLTVQFTDASTNSPTNWTWDFGDGANSTEQNPIHKYTNAGTYNVTLNASNEYGFSVVTREAYITVSSSTTTTTTTTPSGGGGGGAGSLLSSYPSDEIILKEQAQSPTSAGQSFKVTFREEQNPIIEVLLTPKVSVGRVYVVVTVLDGVPDSVGVNPKGEIFKVVDLEVSKSLGSKLESGTVTFQVTKDWLDNLGEGYTITFQHFEDGKWVECPVESSPDDAYTFTASIDSCSPFAITAVQTGEVGEITPPSGEGIEGNETPSKPEETKTEEGWSTTWKIGGILIGLVILVLIWVAISKNQKNQK